MTKKLGKVDLQFNEAYQKVIAWFFAFPGTQIGLSGLAEAVSISKTTAKRIVTTLIAENSLSKEELGKLWRISCNQTPQMYSRKIAYNLSLVYESDIVSEIYRLVPNPRCIILFGSYRKGDDTEKSDIDIAVEVLDKNALKIVELGIIPQFGFRKKVVVNVHFFSRKGIDLNLFANIANGIVLEGFLEVRP